MIECVATDVATMMVDVTEIQGEVEKASGSRLDSSSSPATGVKTALHKLVTKYAGGEVAERLLGVPAKPRRSVTSPLQCTTLQAVASTIVNRHTLQLPLSILTGACELRSQPYRQQLEGRGGSSCSCCAMRTKTHSCYHLTLVSTRDLLPPNLAFLRVMVRSSLHACSLIQSAQHERNSLVLGLCTPWASAASFTVVPVLAFSLGPEALAPHPFPPPSLSNLVLVMVTL